MKTPAMILLLSAAVVGVVAYNFRRIFGVAYSEEFAAAAILRGVPVKRAIAIGIQESNIEMVPGSSGEIGIMQLKPIAVQEVQNRTGAFYPNWQTDPVQNIRAGVAYLGVLKADFGNIDDATRAYNVGPTAARRGDGFMYLNSVRAIQSTL